MVKLRLVAIKNNLLDGVLYIKNTFLYNIENIIMPNNHNKPIIR